MVGNRNSFILFVEKWIECFPGKILSNRGKNLGPSGAGRPAVDLLDIEFVGKGAGYAAVVLFLTAHHPRCDAPPPTKVAFRPCNTAHVLRWCVSEGGREGGREEGREGGREGEREGGRDTII